MQIPVTSPNDSVLNKVNLDQVKQHILAAGMRCTYVNMYNDNPCWELPNFHLYLNPDPGPNGQLQWNINCDISRGDFNTLVVQDKNASSGYVRIEFWRENAVFIEVPAVAKPSEIREIKEVLEAAVLAALKEIKARK
jgi:hypothetical protein